MRLALLPPVSQLIFIPYMYIHSGFLFLILSHQTVCINSPFDQTHLQSQPCTMSDDQSRPTTQKPNEPSPTSRHSIMLLTTSAIGAALLFLSGLTLTGTVISLVIATPVLILFSPILFPTGIIIFLATAGFLFSGSCGVAAAAALAWLYNYIAGKRRRGAVAEQLDFARMRIASRARDMRERARDYGQKVQHNKAQSQEVNQGSELKDGGGGGGGDAVDGGGGDAVDGGSGGGVDGGGSGGGGDGVDGGSGGGVDGSGSGGGVDGGGGDGGGDWWWR